MKKNEIHQLSKERLELWQKQYGKLCRHFEEKNIHQFRVATRRLSSLYSFLSFAGYRQKQKTRHKMKSLFRLLGDIRDEQVNLRVLQNLYFPQHIPESVLQAYQASIKEKEDRLRIWLGEEQKLPKQMEKEEKRVGKFIKNTRKKILRTALFLLQERLEQEYLAKRYPAEEDREDLEALHDLRLQVKKYRYFLETFGSFTVPDHEKLLRELEGIQELLGDINDLDVLRENVLRMGLPVSESVMVLLSVRLQNKIKEFRINF